MTSHLRMNAIYWGLTALCTMRNKEALDREEMIEFVMSCWDDEAGLFDWYANWTSLIFKAGAFGAHPGHDAHILSTLSGIQILITQGALDRLDIPRVVKCASSTTLLDAVTHPPVSHPFSSATFRSLRRRLLWRDRHQILVYCCPFIVVIGSTR